MPRPPEAVARRAAGLFLALGLVAVILGGLAHDARGADSPCDHYAAQGVSAEEMAAWLAPLGLTPADWCAPFDVVLKGTAAPDPIAGTGPCATAQRGDPVWMTCLRFFADGAPLPPPTPAAIPLPASGWLLLAALAGLAWWRR